MKRSERERAKPLWQGSASEEEIKRKVSLFMQKNIRYETHNILGFPGTTPLPISTEVYSDYLDYHSNNIGMHTNKDKGDSELGFGGSQEAERQVIEMVADLMGALPEEVDGYISSGGTEANIVGCWMGRDSKKGAPTVLICSFLTHYSVLKACNILGIGTVIKTNGSGLHLLGTDNSGHILLSQLKKKLYAVAQARIKNIIVVGNGGTTMLGSVDDIPEMCAIIDDFKKDFPATSVHLHIDAAFGGFIVPFIKTLPDIGFQNSNVSSIAIDVHKMGLAPYGSGIILARRGLFKNIETEAPYVPGNDHTLCGSRAGAMALSCWAVMKKMGKDGYAKEAKRLITLSDKIREKLERYEMSVFENDINILAVKSPFPQNLVQEFITHIHKNFPADMTNPLTPERVTVWNIVIMRHTTEALIDNFLSECKKGG
ncbi:MAG: pyridoxal-dependent decarboxylase [Patescibacteria group bacterium]